MHPTMTENEQRADRAANVVLVYRQWADTEGGDDIEEATIDLIADLLHMLDLNYGGEPEAVLRSAWHHFMAERAEEER